MFDTYGPFTQPTHDVAGLEYLFYQQIKVDNTSPDLERGVGVYIVAGQKDSLPHYVGKTTRGFGQRICEHFDKKRFEFLRVQPLIYFLLARAIDGRVLGPDEGLRGDGAKAIDYLEMLLIGTCLKLNPDLLNKQETRFHSELHVAGYIDNKDEQREPAARALAKLLRT